MAVSPLKNEKTSLTRASLIRKDRVTQARRRKRKPSGQEGKEEPGLLSLAMTPVKFGISFTAKFLNQAGALVQYLLSLFASGAECRK